MALCHILIDAAEAFHQDLSSSQKPVWDSMLKMMEYIRRAASAPLVEAELEDISKHLHVDGGLELASACRIPVCPHFQMPLSCMFEPRIPPSWFACLSIVFDSRCSKSPRKPAASCPPAERSFAPIPVLQFRSPVMSLQTLFFLPELASGAGRSFLSSTMRVPAHLLSPYCLRTANSTPLFLERTILRMR